MKSSLLILSFFLLSNLLLAQSLGKGYYVVVGAYAVSKEAYAQKFVESLKKEGFDAIYAKDGKRKLLLVYVERYEELPPSLGGMKKARKEKFPEAWVRIIHDGTTDEVKNEVTKDDVTKQESTPVVTMKEEKVVKEEPRSQQPLVEIKEPEEKLIVIDTSSSPRVPSSVVRSSPRLTFRMFDATNSSQIEGGVEIVDAERARLIQKNKSTDTLSLPDPKSKSGTLSFITDVFGYRKIQHEVNYTTPVVDSTRHYIDREGNFYVIQFEMARYHKGDIATLYNVFFFNDAAIMMPESKYELNKLLELMQSNPNYRIKLHGHTNGNNHGTIISMGPSKNFFAVNASDVKKGRGTAKALSGQRAEVIREWLIAQGISGDRVEVKAWGGHRMIHDKNSVNARRNVRVEVEVLSE
jgi:outer membrane protein OmpA-like peptidoglycan-associated protein